MVVAAVALGATGVAGAQPEGEAAGGRRLVIATKVAEPFVSVVEGGGEPGAEGVRAEALEGISIELWRRIAENMELEYELRVVELDELVAGVAAGRFDAGVGAISVTPEREERLDMTHGYFMGGLGIAVGAGDGKPSWVRGLANIFSWQFAWAVGALSVLLLVVGVLVWLAERRRNAEQFGGETASGIGSGFWFAAVTMTTVGYGDKAPRTLAGRLVALVWMFGSIIVISAFTGAIASSLTAAQFSGAVRGVEDLRTARVGVLARSATVEALRDRAVTGRPFATIEEGLEAVRAGTVDAFVHDWAILQHRVTRDYPGELRMLEAQFNVGAYAIAVPPGSGLREGLNREILSITRSRAWEDVLARYLGSGR